MTLSLPESNSKPCIVLLQMILNSDFDFFFFFDF